VRIKQKMPFSVAKELLAASHLNETSEGWWSELPETTWTYDLEWCRRGRSIASGSFKGGVGTVAVYATKKYSDTVFSGKEASELKGLSKTRDYQHDEPPEIHDGGMGFY
jgi:hypothetical protein